MVFYRTTEAPGTIIVQSNERYLDVVQPGGRALRYGIGVGRDGFRWQGLVKITQKKEWPDWTPPQEMIERQPYLPRWMAGGPGNPLGARAMYLGSTVYRIHGTNQPQTIGTAVSSGCFRLTNPDVARSVRAHSGRHQGHHPPAAGCPILSLSPGGEVMARYFETQLRHWFADRLHRRHRCGGRGAIDL